MITKLNISSSFFNAFLLRLKMMTGFILTSSGNISMRKFGIAAFGFSFPLAAISLIKTGGTSVTMFSPSLFVSVFFMVTNIAFIFKDDISKLKLTLSILLLIILISIISIFSNILYPVSQLIYTPGLQFRNAYITPETYARCLRIFYSLWIVFMMIAVFSKKNDANFRLFCKGYLAGFFIGAFFGAWQFIASVINIPYWTPFGQEEWMLSSQKTIMGFARISGSATEPSNWAPLCLIALAFIFIISPPKLNKKYIFTILFIVFNYIFTFAGTAMVGILFNTIGLFIVFLGFVVMKKISAKQAFISIIFMSLIFAIMIYLISNVEVLAKNFGQGLMEKTSGEDVSGFIRLFTLNLTLDAFFSSPIIGVGIGNVSSFNTFATIIASGGILLGIVYLIMIIKGMFIITKDLIVNPIRINFGFFIFGWGLLGITTISYGEINSFLSWLWIFLCLNKRILN